MSKQHYGILCEHHTKIKEIDGDACCVEFKDGLGDICIECYLKYNVRCNDTTPSPYNSNSTDYWLDMTIAEFKTIISNSVATMNERVFKFIYVDDDGVSGYVDREPEYMTVSEILAIINDEDAHCVDFESYDTTDWIDGTVHYSNYDLVLVEGDILKLNMLDVNVTVKSTVRLTGGFGEETTVIDTCRGIFPACELS